MRQRDNHASRIVVGVDGSPASKAARGWAVVQAERTGSNVQAVIAWHYPVMADAVDPASPVPVSTSVVEGDPAHVLLEAAAGIPRRTNPPGPPARRSELVVTCFWLTKGAAQ